MALNLEQCRVLVRLRSLPPGELPSPEAEYVSDAQTFLSPDKDYDVYAISVYDGVVFLQVVDDKSTPAFLPRGLFDVVDTHVPEDWICNAFPSGPVQLVLGPAFVAATLPSYEAMIDQRQAQVDEFWKRVEGSASTSLHEDE